MDKWVLWSDEALMAVNKPPGLPVASGGHEPGPSLVGSLEPTWGRLWVVHRLDRGTSGVIVLARTSQAHRALNTQFQEHTTLKIYHALVNGEPPWSDRIVDLPLLPDGDRRHRTVVAQKASGANRRQSALTRFLVLERFEQHSLVQAVPETGRTHQIRAHLSAIGFPVAADTLYGGGPGVFLSSIKPGYRASASTERPLLRGTGLHALALTVRHPGTGAALRFEAPYPKDFAATLRQLRKYAQRTRSQQ